MSTKRAHVLVRPAVLLLIMAGVVAVHLAVCELTRGPAQHDITMAVHSHSPVAHVNVKPDPDNSYGHASNKAAEPHCWATPRHPAGLLSITFLVVALLVAWVVSRRSRRDMASSVARRRRRAGLHSPLTGRFLMTFLCVLRV